MSSILGLDLSLSNSGIAVIPFDWGGRWCDVHVKTHGLSLSREACEADRIGRLMVIRNEIMTIARAHRVTHAAIENYAYGARVGLAQLGELGGVVKVALLHMGVNVSIMPPARARALLGKAPRKGVKPWVADRLRKAGAPLSWTEHELDAFATANAWLAENQGHALILRDQPTLPMPGVLPLGSTRRARLRQGSPP